MYIVKAKATKDGYCNNHDFVMYAQRRDEFEPLTKEEAEKLAGILQNYPNLFKDIEILSLKKGEVVPIDFIGILFSNILYNDAGLFPNPEGDTKDGRPLIFDFKHILEDISDDDYDKLERIDCKISGFDRKYTAEHIGKQ